MKTFFKTSIIILTSLIVSLTLVGCDRHNDTPVVKNVYPDVVYHFELDGHKYIIVKYYGHTNDNNVSGMVHDPDCSCFHNN